MMWPVYIPSKRRHESKLLDMLPFSYVVVEPQDRALYEKRVGKGRLIVLPENDQGIAYVRQFILDHNRQQNQAWYWMLDDDISGFYVTKDSKLVKEEGEKVLFEAEKLILQSVCVGQAALEYAQFAWSQTNRVKFHGYCDVAVAINTTMTRMCNYRPEMNLKEDRDFTLQVMANGARTMRCPMLSFRAPKNGSNKGGLQEFYAKKGREEQAVDRMVTAWPGVVEKRVKPDGRIDCKIDWKFSSK